MYNFLLAACGGTGTASGCYDWPVIKQIVWLFSKALGYLYDFLGLIGIANIGLSIILFTIIIKCILLPLTIKQQKFAKITSFMQPEIRQVQDKYRGQKDQYSMQAMQYETKAIYAKYGVTQTGGCLSSFIQFPILIALYGALINIPTAIQKIYEPLSSVADIIMGASDTIKTSLSEIASSLALTDQSSLVKVLYTLPNKSWIALQEAFQNGNAASDALEISNLHDQFVSVNSFLGWDISQSPWNLLRTGTFIGILAVLIPLIAGASQWLSFKLTQTKESAAATGDQMAATTRMMGWMMPLFSVYICFTMQTGLGIYWCMSSFFQVVLQILINRHYRKIDMKAFIEKNKEKAAAKAKKKREKEGVEGTTISAAAKISTKHIESQAPKKPMSISEIANLSTEDAKPTKTKAPAQSLAAKAAMVEQYNQEHPEENSAKRKYKK